MKLIRHVSIGLMTLPLYCMKKQNKNSTFFIYLLVLLVYWLCVYFALGLQVGLTLSLAISIIESKGKKVIINLLK